MINKSGSIIQCRDILEKLTSLLADDTLGKNKEKKKKEEMSRMRTQKRNKGSKNLDKVIYNL
jgi:hypothetical protein